MTKVTSVSPKIIKYSYIHGVSYAEISAWIGALLLNTSVLFSLLGYFPHPVNRHYAALSKS